MSISTIEPDIRVDAVRIEGDMLVVDLKDGRTIATPIAWYPALRAATEVQCENWQIAGAGYGIHWPDIDEDLSTEGMLRGAKGVAPGVGIVGAA